jgi:microcystin-dependent protein
MSEPFLGEVRAMPFGFAPAGWMACQGQLIPIGQNTGLFSLLRTTYGGDGKTNFALPNLAPLQAESGTLQYCIAVAGIYPSRPEPDAAAAACAEDEAGSVPPFTGETRSVGFSFAPPGWLACQGQLVPVAELPDLFKLIGTTFGGDGTTTFGLPEAAGPQDVDGTPLELCISLFGTPPAGG